MDNVGIVSKYGFKNIAILGVIFLLSLIFDELECLFLILFLLSLFIYRNSERVSQNDEANAILSPIDGKVILISQSEENKKFIKVVIKKGLFDSGVIRAICDINDASISRRHGLFLCNFMKDSNLLNEKITLKFNHLNAKFGMEVLAGPLARVLHFERFTNLKAARRVGFMVDGEVVLFLPQDTKLSVEVGEKVKSCDLIGFIDDEK
ncbi:phosphatidylserine decarboxylase [Campylobacter geochelonis]|uniref:phosphatidylserine decarboxylase n=1 Tax=Campylobacter geochelonis TaxID=1780362 RepID=UPI0007707DF4|nr:phosphatidylserine decarboxylase [Campylobacter geochelonis]CZE46988.1 phosphatidylserine decarboxylase [Campylobacter geochelonis]CZE50945.1 phosphatidylserine decarboxylase [Campylobacter geochelonis]